MPTIEYVHHHHYDDGMPLAQVDDTATSKRRRLSPPQDVTSNGQPKSATTKAPIADSLSQLIHHYSEMATDKHSVLWHQFQHLQQVYMQLNHHLNYVLGLQQSNVEQLQQAAYGSNATCYYQVIHNFQNRQLEIAQLRERIQYVQHSQHSIAEATARLQQDRQKVFAAYNLALQHLNSLERNHQQEEQNHTDDIDCVEFAPNDPALTELIQFHPGLSDRDWAKAGLDIGQHTYLQTLNFHDVRCVPRADWEALMRGVAKNRSIRTLELISCNSCWGEIFQILTPFLEHNNKLSRISVANSWLITSKEVRSFSSILERGGGSNLQDIDFSGIRMHDEVASELISSLANLPHLRELDLSVNRIAMRGCDALAALLRRPESKLEILKLGTNNIGDKEVEVLADSLSGNCTLKVMALSNCGQDSKLQGYQPHNSITAKGWAALSNAIRVFNHTLQSVTDPDKPCSMSSEPESTHELEYLLKMNSKEDKKAVAHQKAILIKDIIQLEFDDTLKKKKVLPNILARISGSELAPAFVLIRNMYSLWNE